MILWYPLFKDVAANDNAFAQKELFLNLEHEENLNGAFLTHPIKDNHGWLLSNREEKNNNENEN